MAGLLDIIIIVILGPISLRDLNKNVSPRTKPTTPLEASKKICAMDDGKGIPKIMQVRNIKTDVMNNREMLRLNEPICVTTAEKMYGEIDHKIEAAKALNSPINFFP